MYHEYKTRSRTTSQEVGGRSGRETKRETRKEVRKENRAVAAYGGKGEHPGRCLEIEIRTPLIKNTQTLVRSRYL